MQLVAVPVGFGQESPLSRIILLVSDFARPELTSASEKRSDAVPFWNQAGSSFLCRSERYCSDGFILTR
jgi:hypothetical protein